MRTSQWTLTAALVAATTVCAADEGATMKITSHAFDSMGSIPAKYTCQGADTSPPLAFSGLPEGTKSLALIVDDPDAPDPKAPKMTWVHWVLYDMPLAALAEGAAKGGLPAGTREGKNDWKRTGWGGPCPPIGRHRYFFKLYALDTTLGDLHEPTKAALEAAMAGQSWRGPSWSGPTRSRSKRVY